MTRAKKDPFGGESRAQDGVIATFELEDGSVHVERFTQLVVSTVRAGGGRNVRREGDPYVEQAAARADELGATIISLSSPATIFRDLQGARVMIETRPTGTDGIAGGKQRHPSEQVDYPEATMLARIGRLDLMPARRRRVDDASTSIRHVHAPRRS